MWVCCMSRLSGAHGALTTCSLTVRSRRCCCQGSVTSQLWLASSCHGHCNNFSVKKKWVGPSSSFLPSLFTIHSSLPPPPLFSSPSFSFLLSPLPFHSPFPSSRPSLYISQMCGSSVKHIETFHGGTHNGTWTSYGYYEHINRFINYVSAALMPVERYVAVPVEIEHY